MAIKRWGIVSVIIFLFATGIASGYFLFFTRSGAEIVLGIFLTRLPAGLQVSYGRLHGDLARGVVCSDAVLSGVTFLPPGTLVKAEKAHVIVYTALPVGLLIEAENGKVELPNGSVVFFRGNYTAGNLNVNLFTPQTGFATIASFLPRSRILKSVAGTITDIDIAVSGTFREPHFKGNFSVPEAALKHLSIEDLRCAVDLTLRQVGGKPWLYGTVAVGPTTVFLRQSIIRVDPGKVIFDGEPEKFVFRLRGVSKVEDTAITLVLSGTVDKPDFRLTSVPAMPQDKLLLMLLTGKSWADTGQALEKGTLSTDVAKDFVDFLFLGGTGATLSERLGVESVHLTYDAKTQGIEIKKSLSDSTSVTYGIKEEKPDTLTEAEPIQTQKLGLEYKITDKLSIEGTQEFRHLINATQQETTPPESQIQLKYKKSF